MLILFVTLYLPSLLPLLTANAAVNPFVWRFWLYENQTHLGEIPRAGKLLASAGCTHPPLRMQCLDSTKLYRVSDCSASIAHHMF